jgi:hypothetical protein
MIFDDSFKKEFSKLVVQRVLNDKLEYMETVIELAEEFEIDLKMAAKCLSKPIIEKISKEAQDVNLIDKTSKLPF